MSKIVTMMATSGGQGGGGGGSLPLHPVRPPRLPDLPPLAVPGGAHRQRGDERDAGRLVAPGVRQQPRRQAHRSVVSPRRMSVMLMWARSQPAVSLSWVPTLHQPGHGLHERLGYLVRVASHLHRHSGVGAASGEDWGLLPRGKCFLPVDHEDHGLWCNVTERWRKYVFDWFLMIYLQQAHDCVPLYRLHNLAWMESPRGLSLFQRTRVQGWMKIKIISKSFLYATRSPFSLVHFHNYGHFKWFLCQDKIPRKLSDKAHRRMKMVFDRRVNTTICDPEEWLPWARPRWHPHKAINPALIRWHAPAPSPGHHPWHDECFRAPVHPYISRSHRRNLKVLD